MPVPKSTRRSNGKWLLPLIAIFSLIALLAAACGGDDGDGGSIPTQTPDNGQTPVGDQAAAPTAAQTPAEGASAVGIPDGDPTSVEGFTQELQALATGWADQTAKVTYEISQGGDWEGVAQPTEDLTGGMSGMTLYWRFPDWRVDISSNEGDVSMIVTGEMMAVCAEGTCMAIENINSADTLAPPFLDEFINPDALTASITDSIDDVMGFEFDTFQETIAGESADCFSMSGSFEGESGQAEWCFTDDGILLRIAASMLAEDGEVGEFRLDATAVSRDVSDADFEPPYPVTDLTLP